MANVFKSDSLEMKIWFNDYCMREMSFDIDDNNHLVDLDSMAILQIKEKFITYTDELYPVLMHNEMDLNLLENFRLMETLFQMFITNYARAKNMDVVSFSQSRLKGTKKGKFTLTHRVNGEIHSIESDPFENDSVRIFNLVCKLRNRTHLYDFDQFDIIIEKDKRK